MNIYLIGFMATGKSTVGREVARVTGRTFIDLDGYIEEKSGMKVKDIFRTAGEKFFRGLEKKYLAEVAAQDKLIVACGGGIVIDPDNVRVMKDTGKVVCLTASMKEIEERSGLSQDRPLLETGERKETIEKLLKERGVLYKRAADKTIDTTDMSCQDAASRVIEFMRAKAQ